MFLAGDCMMSGIPGFGGEESYEEPLPPHDPEDEPDYTDEAAPSHVDEYEEAEEKKADADSEDVNEASTEGTQNEDAEGAEDDGAGGEEEEDDEEESDDEGFVVTIGQVKQNFSFSTAPKTAAGGGKLDLDATPSINGQPIYDLDLASVEDRPWRKPGADINDYFNYGFCEETWNMYCERQKKLRAEYGTQAAVNKALFSSINLINPVSQICCYLGGRQLQTIPIIGQENKNTIDLSSFKAVEQVSTFFFRCWEGSGFCSTLDLQPVIRTVLTAGQQHRAIGTGGTSGTSVSNVGTPESDNGQQISTANLNPPTTVEVDFSKPPPPIETSAPPGKSVISIPPLGITTSLPPPSVGDGPPGLTPQFNPLLPPPNLSAPPPAVRLGLPNTNVPPPSYSVPPPGFTQPPPGFPPPRFGPPGVTGPPPISRPPPLMGRPAYPPPGVEGRRDSRETEERDRERGRDRDRERDRDRDSGDRID
ncbi:unnamed protein product [Enterobius vermicularis]|uniref:Pre-mRNA 3'-end-processing factor FIP1 n=1 Tax=Enterobius vermicularis TaxID=51028 RepID=A0A0N4UWA7_ENTVE|nr:unnamed protein product [Enterobius vermicularis]